MIEISKREHFYQQEYCGCVYSLRDTNRYRVEQGRERIQIGELYYGLPPGEKPDLEAERAALADKPSVVRSEHEPPTHN